MANGDRLVCSRVVSELKWCMHGHKFTTSMRELEIGAYDSILGMHWLDQLSPMTCHWQEHLLVFVQKPNPQLPSWGPRSYAS